MFVRKRRAVQLSFKSREILVKPRAEEEREVATEPGEETGDNVRDGDAHVENMVHGLIAFMRPDGGEKSETVGADGENNDDNLKDEAVGHVILRFLCLSGAEWRRGHGVLHDETK